MTMPHLNGTSSAAGDDLGSSDEIKVFKVEGEEKDEERLSSSEVLTEDKSSLITVCEGPDGEGKSSSSEQNYGSPKAPLRPESTPLFGRGLEPLSHASSFGYFMSPAYAAYTNGVGMGVSAAAAASLSAASMAGRIGPHHTGSPLSFFYPGADPLSQPPPAHMGIPPYQLDPKSPGGLSSLPRPPMYHFPTAQYSYPMLGAEMAQMASWHTQSMYPISSAGSGFRSPYPTGLQLTATTLPRFSPSFLTGHHPNLGATHPALLSPGHPASMSSFHHGRPDGLHMGILGDHAQRNMSHGDKGPTTSSGEPGRPNDGSSNSQEKKKPHIKKPLNAFMLYMKDMRAKVVAECTLKESAAINQILGRRWHTLSREEQSRYYEMARQQRQLHMQLYPSWSLRDSHNSTSRKKKRKRDKTADGGNNLKKCRARYGLDQQNQWCKPCRRKKKCIRYMDNGDGETEEPSEEPLGSVGEDISPKSKHNDESDDSSDDDETSASDLGLSSPGMSLSSLASPAVMPSPSASLASPLTPSPATPSMPSHHSFLDKPLGPPHRVPIGSNPHDINNPLSVNQLCGKDKAKESSHTMLSVT